ncbi:hypothetical protein [Kosmotoga pacifica]|uniref:Uncharacterized protein n=1 Tax=Kosmotoga pacifica TaxID=1330330 RepID=A0A0G2ZCV5_9BACT|nr:hypothetical protein [Kosmotoga pacifica]AKI96593.1 hypothetical protein IX53_00765 [Kosmotoga pacifica]
MFGQDKILHFILGFMIATIVGILIGSSSIGGLVGIGAGAAKEAWDAMGHGVPEEGDYVATEIGAVLGTLVAEKVIEESNGRSWWFTDIFKHERFWDR